MAPLWTVYGIVLDGQMDSRLAESLLMLPDEVTTLSLANVDHIKLTTIVVRVVFAVASLAHALLATVCMHAWNLLTQTAHRDPTSRLSSRGCLLGAAWSRPANWRYPG